MAHSFVKLVADFSKKAFVFDDTSSQHKLQSLQQLAKSTLHVCDEFLQYHSLLLYTLTHAENKAIFDLAQNEIKRLTAYLKKGKHASHPLLADSGLPFTTMTTRYAPEVFNELVAKKQANITLDSLGNEAFDLNAFCTISLPSVLKAETTAGLDNDSLMEVLGVAGNKKFEFLLNEINNIQASPLAKDYIWQSLNPFFCITGKQAAFSKTYNRIAIPSVFYTQKLTKQFNHVELLDQALPKPTSLTNKAHQELVSVIQNTMTLAFREIDPITYMDKKSLKFFHLSNGLSMAVFGMLPERQLPLQSYVGYTLFKNGYPISYGGAWMFGKCALFALNIFEEYRGGESKYVMTQILRVYRQLFNVCYFEVEPYQIGNEDALQSGAFWFYHKFGFRPVEPDINKLAEAEVKKMGKNKSYKSSIQTLAQLAKGNIALHIHNERFCHRNEVIYPIVHLIANTYKGNHGKAIQDAKAYFIKLVPGLKKRTAAEELVFEEVALWAYALKIKDQTKLNLMAQLIQYKPKDYIAYNQLISAII
jgi:hypothetical protein